MVAAPLLKLAAALRVQRAILVSSGLPNRVSGLSYRRVTNLIERLHGEIQSRTNVLGIFPNEGAITRLVGAILLGRNDEWAVASRYMTLESIAPVSENLTVKLPAMAA